LPQSSVQSQRPVDQFTGIAGFTRNPVTDGGAGPDPGAAYSFPLEGSIERVREEWERQRRRC